MKKGNDYKLVNLSSTKTLKNWVEDNSEAYDQASLARQYSNRVKMHQIINLVGIIGGLALIASDPSGKGTGNVDVRPLSYVGLGMFCRGLINMPINGFVRRAKAGKAYASAINIYNETPVKRKK